MEAHLKNTEEIVEIRTEFDGFKRDTNRRLDEILDKLKPQFTYPQITGFLLTLVVTLAGAMIYITDVKSDSRNNTTRIKNIENQYQNINAKLDVLVKEVAHIPNGKEIKTGY